jgi:tetratricopeptide (TPR) repeat protein
MYRAIPFFVVLNCLAHLGCAQDSINTNDVKVIKAKSEIIIGRYFSNLLNTISYAGAESTDITALINQSFTDSAKKLFLNSQVAITDDISDPDYSGSANAPDVTAIQYLNAFNTFYGKSDSNSVFIHDVRSSRVKEGKKNMYINVYFTSFFKNICLSHPSVPYKPVKRVAEIYIKRSNNNKWLLYIERIGFFNPADTLNDLADDMVVVQAKNTSGSSGALDETLDSADKFNLYIDQAHIEESKRNYQAAVNFYSRAIELAPGKRALYEPRITELNTSLQNITRLEKKYNEGNYKDAVKEYTALLKKPELNSGYANSDYYLGRAKCYDKMGEMTKSYNEQVAYYDKALHDYNKSYEYDHDQVEAIRLRADLERRMNENKIPEIKRE